MGCSEKSELRKTEIAEGLYTKREISKDYTLYWRVLPDTQEIEIAMKVKGMYLVNISEIRSLCLIKCSSQTPNIHQIFDIRKPRNVIFFFFHLVVF